MDHLLWHDMIYSVTWGWDGISWWDGAMRSHKTRTKKTQEYKFVGWALLWCTVCFHNLSLKVYDFFPPITSLQVCCASRKGWTEKIRLNKLNLWDKYCSDGQSIFILSIWDHLTSNILTSLHNAYAWCFLKGMSWDNLMGLLNILTLDNLNN